MFRALQIALVAAFCAVYAAFGSDNLALGVPGPADQVLDRDGYALGYSSSARQPLWVTYRLTASEVTNRVVRRTDDFQPDPWIETEPVTPADYLRSGYDRGHLAPAADMLWSSNVMVESFLMSNMSPQRPAFNRGIWARLEQAVRQIAVREGSVFVVTGPVFDLTNGVFESANTANRSPLAIGRTGVRVPDGYYKVLLDETPPRKAIGFILPNAGSNRPLGEFACTVDDVERATGLDFFQGLDDPSESELESAPPDLQAWQMDR